MAYMNQEKKAKIAPVVKAICKKYGVKASLAVHNYSTLVLNIKSGPIDFFDSINRIQSKRYDASRFSPVEDSLQVNVYWYQENYDGKALDFLSEIVPALNDGNHDRSDSQSDYFDVGWYVDVNVGAWNKPYVLEN